ncbi:hypothetical protein ACFY94_19875 [Streptomyces griseorubiginosus]|uniref:hypothetical protein n=1 Tax=Streptomyces griseorubiginosus TaxID=67304 RepID=UPI0036EAF14D
MSGPGGRPPGEDPEEHTAAEPEPDHGPSREHLPPGTYLPPYTQDREGAPAQRSRPVTAALMAVAVVVALGAGSAVHTALTSDGPATAPSSSESASP